MKIVFKEHGTNAEAVLVAQSNEGVGVWFGPFAVGNSFARVIDRKQPIDADMAVLRSMKNESGAYKFSAHHIAATVAAAAQLVLAHRLSLPKGNGALIVTDAAGTYTLLSDCAIGAVELPETIGCYVRADYTIEY